jgi:hypothetical protein
MAVYFTLDKEIGFLNWSTLSDRPDLTIEEAQVIAAAETAAALRSIAAAISDLGGEIRDKKILKDD